MSGRGSIMATLRKNALSMMTISKSGGVCTVGIRQITIGGVTYGTEAFSQPNWVYRLNSDGGVSAEAAGIAVWNNVLDGLSLEIMLTTTDLYTEFVTSDHSKLPTRIELSLQGCDGSFFTPPTMYDGDSGVVPVANSYVSGVLVLEPQYTELGDINGEVRIDPSVSAGLAANVFTSQGMPNGHSRRFLLAAPNFTDTTNGAWAGRAETYLLYDIHGAISDRGNTGQAIVTGATLRLRHYTNNGAAFAMYIGRLLQGFDGATGSGTNQWRSRTGAYVGGTIGSGYFPSHTDLYFDVTGIVRDIWGGQPNYGLAVWGEGGGYASGSAFCSSRADGWCQAWEAPVLTVNSVGNYRPRQAAISPGNNAVITGNCDQSAGTGTCYTGNSNVTITITEMSDPDTVAPATYAYTAVNYTSTYFDANGVSTTFTGTQTNITPTSGTTSTRVTSLKQGRVTYQAINVDGMGANYGAWTYATFINDFMPPATPRLGMYPSVLNERGMDIPLEALVIDNVTAKGEVSYQFRLRNSRTGQLSTSVWIRPATGASGLAFQLGRGGMDGLLGTVDDIVPGDIYYVQVRAKDNYNNISYWSLETYGFLTDFDAPVVTRTEHSSLMYSRLRGGTETFRLYITEKNLMYCSFYLRDLQGNRYTFASTSTKTKLANDSYVCTQDFSGQVKRNGVVVNLEDGTYVLEYELIDAGEHNVNSSNSASYSTDPEIFANYIFQIDSTAPEISVTQPYEGFYTKQDTVPVSGQIVDNRAVSMVKILSKTKSGVLIAEYICESSEVAITTEVGCRYNQQGVFTANVAIGEDGAVIDIFGTDSAGNETYRTMQVHRELAAPEISDVLVAGIREAAFSDSTPRVEFTVSEVGDMLLNSGILPTGLNAARVRVDMVYQALQNNVLQTIRKALFAEGVRLDSNLVSDLSCLPSGEAYERNGYTVYKKVTCSFGFISALPHDTTYAFEIAADDVAGNSAMSTTSATLDTQVYAELYQPTYGGLYARSRILVEVKASRGSVITLTHQPSGATIQLIMHESLNGQEVGGLLGGVLDVLCVELVDHDQDSATEDEVVCRLKSRINTSYSDNWDPLNNSLELRVVDDAGNAETRTTDFIISPTNFSIIIAPDYGFLSPNGDGMQDVLQITHQVVNTDNPDPFAQPEVAGYEWRLYNKSAIVVGGVTVVPNTLLRIISANTPLPYSTIFDGYMCIAASGQIDATMTACTEWEEGARYVAISDGNYEHALTIITFEGARVTSGHMPLLVKSTMSDAVTLTSPQPASTTTSGVVLVTGIGPKPIDRPLTSTLRGNVTVVLCIDIEELGVDTVCNSRVTVAPAADGSFSTLVTLPAPTTINQTYRISAYAIDQFGVRTPASQTAVIAYDRRDAIVALRLNLEYQVSRLTQPHGTTISMRPSQHMLSRWLTNWSQSLLVREQK